MDKSFLREINSLGFVCFSESSSYFITSLKLKIGFVAKNASHEFLVRKEYFIAYMECQPI